MTTNQTKTFHVDFVSESAGFENTFGWYNKVTGVGGILFTNVEADGRRAPLHGGSSVEFTVDAADAGNIEFFLIPNGGAIGANTDSELSRDVKVIQLADGSWAIATLDSSGNVQTGHNGKPNTLVGAGSNAFFTEKAKNEGGVDHASSAMGRHQTASTLAGDTADGPTGLLAWEDLAATKKHIGTWSSPGDADYNDAVFRISVKNAKPDANNDSVTVGEDAGPTLINVLANDTDANGDALEIVSVKDGHIHGTVTIAPGGTGIIFDPGSAYQYLGAGESKTETFKYKIDDGQGGTDTAKVTVTITGENDAPVVVGSADLAGAVTERPDGAADENAVTLSASGNISFTDIDRHDQHTVSVVAQGGGYRGALTATVAGDSNGDGAGFVSWAYSVDDAALDDLAAGEVLTQTYTIKISDGHGGFVEQDVTITITGAADGAGANSAPVITSSAQTGSVTEVADNTAGENATTLSQSGAVTFSDADAADTHTAAVAPQAGGYLGTLTLGAVAAGSVDWTFAVEDSALDHLQAGEVLTQLYDVTVDDGHGGTAVQTVTVTITGTNDAPTITSGVQAGAATEAADLAPDENATTHSANGAVTFADVDASDTHSASFAAQGSGYLGTFALNPVNQAGGSVGWTFSVADSILDSLRADEVLTQNYDVTVDDGHGGMVTQAVTVTINGSNDAPVDIALSGQTVAENADGAVIGTLSTVDADNGDTHTYTVSDARFEVVGNELKLKSGEALNYESEPEVNVVVTSTDTAGGAYVESFTIGVNDVNEAPTSIVITNAAVNENTDDVVVGAVSAVDPDAGDIVTFSVDDTRFEIVDGNLKLKDGVTLDFENEPEVLVTVTATDSGGLTFDQGFTINVADGFEALAIDGYISGATVFADADGDGVLDAGEASATTDAFGNFTLFGGSGELVMFGGTDISTNQAFEGVMRAPEGSSVVTPLTTLVVAIAESAGVSVAEANTQLLQGLGLAAGTDLSSFDPVAATLSSDPIAQAQGQAAIAAAVQIQNTIVQASSLLEGAGATFADAAAAVVTQLATQINTQVTNNETVDLNDSAVIQSVITAAGTESGANTQAVADAVVGAGNVIASSNGVIDDAVTNGQTGTDLLTTLAQVSIVAGDAAAALSDAGAGTTDISTVESGFTGSNLTDAVDAAEDDVGDVAGVNGDDIVVGTADPDVLLGYGGNDTISGLAGNDVIDGGDGNDALDGGDGRDRSVYSTATGGISVDLAAGTVTGTGVGADTLQSVEMIRGSNLADTYFATGFGQAGATNVGSFGTFNQFEGMGGNDSIVGNGVTGLSYQSATAAVTVDLVAGTATGDSSVGTDTFSGVGSVRGSSFNDTLLGSNPTSTLEIFTGGRGDDLIDGRGGMDRAVYSPQIDNDVTGGVTIEMSAGTVTGDASVGTDTLRAVEAVRGSNFADSYNATNFGVSGANVGSNGSFNEFEGAGGNDTITGNGNTRISFTNATAGVTVDLLAGTATGDASVGADTITGGVNSILGSQFGDTLYGSNNAPNTGEQFEGRAGNDIIDGRGGFDVAIYGSDPSITTGISVDMAAGTVTGDAAVGADTLIAVESVRGTGLADTYVATGFAGASADLPAGVTFNEFEGAGGNDTITGNGNTRIAFSNSSSSVTVDLAAGTATGFATGTDTFTGVSRARGSNLNDTISGDVGANVLEGQGGADTLDGRGGNDTLLGGQGGDTFVYANGGGADAVTDFNQAQGDKIDLAGVSNVFSISDVYALATGSTINFGGGNSLTLTGVTVATLNASDFIFAPNLPPTDIALSNNSAAENSANGTVVGALTGTDPNSGEPLTYTLTDDAGGRFAISGGNLVVAGALDFESNASHQVTVQVTDRANSTYSETFTVDVADVNEAPTDIALSGASVAENSANGTVVGALSAIDADAGDTATFSLIDDAGGRFAISGGNLVVAGALDCETATSHSVTVQVTDSANNTYDETFSIGVTDVNETPTDIALSGTSVAENSANGTVVGALSAVDPDVGDTATFSLIDNAGGRFAISGGNLVVAGALDYETATSHSVTVRVTDSSNNTYDETFSIGVTDVAGVNTTGDANDNTLIGTTEADTLVGLDGTDTLQGLGDNDLLNGGNGRDWAVYTDATGGITANLAAGTVSGAGVGSDTLQSIELLRGSNFADTINATGFNGSSANAGSFGTSNTIEGMGGNDTITSNGNTLLSYQSALGGVSVNLLTGSASSIGGGDAAGIGVDTLSGTFLGIRGSDFADTLSGANNASGVEAFTGGTGDDSINGLGGLDRAQYASFVDDNVTGGVTVNMAMGTVTGDASVGTDTLRSVEFVRGSNFADTYDATNFGAAGFLNSSVNNVGSNGTFNELEGMGGNDTITGNGNTRLAFYNATAGVTVDLVAGTATGDATVGNDTITGGVNSLVGSQFGDTFYGSDNVTNTSEVFEGRGGNDTFDGRGGYDQAIYNNDTAVTTGISVDMFAGTVTGNAAVGTDTLIFIESVRGTGYADTYVATGFAGASSGFPGGLTFNEFEGMGGNDTITGNGNTRVSFVNSGASVTVDLAAGTATGVATGADTFTGVSRARGSNSNDTISGNASDNVLEGQGGADRIDGRGGLDTLNGGQGADTFVFTSLTNGLDTIIDWKTGGADILEITGSAFGSLAANSAVTLVSGADAASASGLATNSFFLDNDGADVGTVYFDATGGLGDDAVAFVKIQGLNPLLASDFHVV